MTTGATRFVSRHVHVVGGRLNAARDRLTDFGRQTNMISVTTSTARTTNRRTDCRHTCTRGRMRVDLIGRLGGRVLGRDDRFRIVPTGVKLGGDSLGAMMRGCGRVLVRHGHLLHASRRSGPTIRDLGTDVRMVHGDMVNTVRATRGNLLVGHRTLRTRAHGCTNGMDSTPMRRGRCLDVSHRRRVRTGLCLVLLRGHRRGGVALTSATGGTHIVSRPLTNNRVFPAPSRACVVTLMLNLKLPMNLVFL